MISKLPPTWTIVIPSYNYGHFVTETLQSVFFQECDDLQVVLVDDASTDDTAAVIEPFLCRIEYIRNPVNLGAGGAWRVGLEQARGKFVIKLDADDQLAPGALAAYERVFESNSRIGIAISSSLLMDQATQQQELRKITEAYQVLSAEQFRHRLLGGFFFKMPSCVLRAEMLREQVPPAAQLFQLHDWEYLLRVTRNWQAALLPEAGSIYRVHNASITSTAYAQDRLHKDMDTWLSLASETGQHQLAQKEIRRLKGSFGELLVSGHFPAANLRSVRSFLKNYARATQISLDGGWNELLRMHLSAGWKASRKLFGKTKSSRVLRKIQ